MHQVTEIRKLIAVYTHLLDIYLKFAEQFAYIEDVGLGQIMEIQSNGNFSFAANINPQSSELQIYQSVSSLDAINLQFGER